MKERFIEEKSIFFITYTYRKDASSNTSRLEAHAGIFRFLMKGIFDPYVLWPFDKKLIFSLVTRFRTRDYKVDGNVKFKSLESQI